MSLVLRILLAAVSIAFLVVIVRMVVKNRLLLRFSFLWLILGFLGFISAALPVIPISLAVWLGFSTPAGFVFFLCLAILLGLSLMLTTIISKQARYIKRLVQEISIIKSDDSHNGSER